MATKKKAKTSAKKSAKKAKATPARKAARKRPAAARKAAARPARPKASKARAKKPVARSKAKAKKPVVRSKAKAPARATAAGRATARAKPIQRRDRAGHLDPKYAAELREKAGEHVADPTGFVERARSRDDLVEELGEEFVNEATSAEHEGEDVLNQEVPEERGGPFVETSGDQEFGHGTDASNPKGASREPFPRT